MPAPEGGLAALQARFADFARTYPDLRLYADLRRHVAEDTEAAALLTAARPGQDRPVLWLAAVHDLVLRRPDLPAARWYPSVVGPGGVPAGDPWPDVRATVLEHRDELTAVIATRATQTNEVNRSVYVAAGLAVAAADRPDDPVVLVEMGASAGLLLDVDRYRVELAGAAGAGDGVRVLGDPGSPVVCRGVDRAPDAIRGLSLPPVAGRVGLDLHPVRLADVEARRWLEACLWPDVPGRVERFRAAVAVARTDPPDVVAADMVNDLEEIARRTREEAGGDAPAHVAVLSSWALTYVERSRRPDVLVALAALARDGGAVSWLTAEPPGAVPGLPRAEGMSDGGPGTVLGLHRWRDGRAAAPVLLGPVHQHGEWVDLPPPR